MSRGRCQEPGDHLFKPHQCAAPKQQRICLPVSGSQTITWNTGGDMLQLLARWEQVTSEKWLEVRGER